MVHRSRHSLRTARSRNYRTTASSEGGPRQTRPALPKTDDSAILTCIAELKETKETGRCNNDNGNRREPTPAARGPVTWLLLWTIYGARSPLGGGYRGAQLRVPRQAKSLLNPDTCRDTLSDTHDGDSLEHQGRLRHVQVGRKWSCSESDCGSGGIRYPLGRHEQSKRAPPWIPSQAARHLYKQRMVSCASSWTRSSALTLSPPSHCTTTAAHRHPL